MALLALAGAAVVALVLVVALGNGRSEIVRADTDSGLDFSASVGTECDSGGTASSVPPNVCNIARGATFTMNFKINVLPNDALPDCGQDVCGYQAYDMRLSYTGVSVIQDSLVSQGPDVWPDCAFVAIEFGTNPNTATPYLLASCSIGIGAPNSPYVGVLLHLDFQCPDSDVAGTLTLQVREPNVTNTDLVTDLSFETHFEANPESLTINCGTPPTPTLTNTPTPGGATATPTETPTPGGATATPTFTATNTPTITPTPTFTVTPTRTRRPHETLRGDVDGDLTVDARDALWVLWFNAGIVVDVPIPEAADMNEDDVVDATDALFILWVDAGTYQPL